jgi:hypothetical protein
MKVPGFNPWRLCTSSENLVSEFAFKFNLHRYLEANSSYDFSLTVGGELHSCRIQLTP